MKATLRLTDDGWVLENSDGDTVDSGAYPLRETDDFVESAAKKLDFWRYHKQPYNRIDERSGGDD